MTSLLFTALIVVVLNGRPAGASATGQSAVPLVDALKCPMATSKRCYRGERAGLAGLSRRFFSIIYGY